MRGYAEWLETKEGQKTEDADKKRVQALKMEEDYLKIEKERFAVAEASAEEIATPVRRKRSR